jgi:S-adenosyl-l-methionine hydroxide adenosyltransferase
MLVNVAPRNGKAKKWANGTPFGYFRFKNVLVVSTVDGLTLSLIKKLKLVEHIQVLDIPTVMSQFVQEQVVTSGVAEHIINTQFRSFDFTPRVGAYLLHNTDLPSEKLNIEEIESAPSAVWWVDNFGNCKTTLLKSEVEQTESLSTAFGQVQFFNRLKDVPDNTTALITGSSGIGEFRFLEVVSQGQSAANTTGLSVGSSIF